MATSGLNLILINFTKSLRLLLSTYNQYVLDTKKDYAKVRSIILNSPEIYDICKSIIICLFFDSLDAEILH